MIPDATYTTHLTVPLFHDIQYLRNRNPTPAALAITLYIIQNVKTVLSIITTQNDFLNTLLLVGIRVSYTINRMLVTTTNH
jgi:hypothetical protein